MNCDHCGNLVYANQKTCRCGNTIYRRPQPDPERRHLASPSAEVSRAFGARLTQVNAYIEDYRSHHPGASQREACLAYMREHNLIKTLPEGLLSESEQEAQAERKAIQGESG